MGELTFTFLIIQLLATHSINDCYASTSDKKATIQKLANQIIKNSVFEFIRFRKYQIIKEYKI